MFAIKGHCRHFHRNSVFLKNSKFKLDYYLENTGNFSMKKSLEPGLQYTPFAQRVEARRSEAKRTVMVQVKSPDSARDLLNYCNARFGNVKSMHFHRNLASPNFSDFFLVELESREILRAALSNGATHCNDAGSQPIPVVSPFLWFSGRKENSDLTGEGKSDNANIFLSHDVLKSEKDLEKIFLDCQTIDEQMIALHDNTKLTSLSTRLRFLACEQLELAMGGMFPNGKVLPFGSSVNSFGKFDADLDMVYDLEVKEKEVDSRLWFHVKVNKSGGLRILKKRYCDQMANVIQNLLPGCKDVMNITHARVPIVKYRQQFLGLECDLNSAMSGYYMSELLYLYGELDTRVRPLVFTIRKWAKGQGLINNTRPTPLFTNFSLTLMIIFFLQCRYQMLPSFQNLQKMARKQDNVVCEGDVNCTFLRDISGYQLLLNKQWQSQPHLIKPETEPLTLSQMLSDFFDFYSHFDFKRKAICVVSGEPQPKRGASTSTQVSEKISFFIDVTNPLERDLNVAGNVQQHAVTLFQSKCRESLKKMFFISQTEVDLGSSKLSYIVSGQIAKLKVNLKDLGPLDDTPKPTKREKPPKRPEMSHEERRYQEGLKKKWLRVPKADKLYDPKI